MKVIVMGCGRIGAALAAQLGGEGHDVRVFDRDRGRAELLPGSFTGRFLVGNGFDRAVLEEAGIRSADAFTAVTSSDNTNIVGARIAKEDYHVPRVVAHIYDPARADIFRDLGIPTVASVRWTATRVHQMLLHRHVEPEVVFGNGETLLITETLPAWFGARRLRALDVDGEIHVVAVTRGGHSFLPARGSLAEPGDEVTFAVAATALGRLRSFLDKELGT